MSTVLPPPVRIEHELSEGAFGPISSGNMEGLPVAVKELRASCSEEEELAFFREAFIISQFNHSNVMRVLAVSLSGKKVQSFAVESILVI